MRQHHSFFSRPKDDSAFYSDVPYHALPRTHPGRGGYYAAQTGYPVRVRSLWKLKAILWLIILSISAYCVYYLLPCSHLVVLGITLHP